jgi:hypothetical protein
MPQSGHGDAPEQAMWLNKPVGYVAVKYDVPLTHQPLLQTLPDNVLRPRVWLANAPVEQAFNGRPPGVYARRQPNDEEIEAKGGNRIFDILKEFKNVSGLSYRTFSSIHDAFDWYQAREPAESAAGGASGSFARIFFNWAGGRGPPTIWLVLTGYRIPQFFP